MTLNFKDNVNAILIIIWLIFVYVIIDYHSRISVFDGSRQAIYYGNSFGSGHRETFGNATLVNATSTE